MITALRWSMRKRDTGLVDFVENFTDDLRINLSMMGRHDFVIVQNELDRQTGFILKCASHNKHYTEIMITRSKEVEGYATLDRFWGMRTANDDTTASSPQELRAAAQLYDDVTQVLEGKYGKPVSEHDGRSIYRGKLDQPQEN